MGVLGNYRDSVTLINRTTTKLNVRYDGEDIELVPGENPGFPKIAVQYAKNQNPLKGSKHPSDPRRFICKVGVKGTKDDVSPIPQKTLDEAEGKLEAVDRDGQWHGEPMRQVKLLKKSGYSTYEAATEISSDYAVNPNIE